MTGALPRLRPGLVAVPLADGLLVHGGAQRQMFRGRAAVGLLPRLLPLLDGTALTDDVAEQIGASPTQLSQALDLLSARGLIDYGPAAPGPPGVNPAVAAFLTRVGGAAGPHATTAGGLERLARAEILLVARDGLHLDVVKELAGVGLRRVHHVHPDALGRAAAVGLPPADLVIAIEGVPASPWPLPSATATTTLDRWCRRHRARWLRVAPTGAGVEIGPLFDCWNCWRSRPDAQCGPGDQPRKSWLEAATGPDGWACLVALEAFDIVTGLDQSKAGAPRSSHRYDLENWSNEATPAAIATCRHCSPDSDDQFIDRPIP